MSHEPSVKLSFFQEPNNVLGNILLVNQHYISFCGWIWDTRLAYFCSKTIASSAYILDTLLLSYIFDCTLDHRVHILWQMCGSKPFHEIKVCGVVQRHSITLEEVRNHGKITVGGQLIG